MIWILGIIVMQWQYEAPGICISLMKYSTHLYKIVTDRRTDGPTDKATLLPPIVESVISFTLQVSETSFCTAKLAVISCGLMFSDTKCHYVSKCYERIEFGKLSLCGFSVSFKGKFQFSQIRLSKYFTASVSIHQCYQSLQQLQFLQLPKLWFNMKVLHHTVF